MFLYALYFSMVNSRLLDQILFSLLVLADFADPRRSKTYNSPLHLFTISPDHHFTILLHQLHHFTTSLIQPFIIGKPWIITMFFFVRFGKIQHPLKYLGVFIRDIGVVAKIGAQIK